MEVKPKITKCSIYDANNWFGKVYCFWVIPFFKIFVKHSNFDTNESTLEIEDLNQCAHEDQSEELYRQFEGEYHSCISQCQSDENWFSEKRLFGRLTNIGRLFRKNPFLLTLVRTFQGESFVLFLLFAFQDCIIKPIQPILIGLIIRYFYKLSETSANASKSSSISTLYCLTITTALCLSSLLLIASHHPSLQLAMKLSMRVKIVWSSLIYNKCLKLTANSPNSHNLSYLINLMTNDVRRFDEFSVMAHYLLIVPIQTVLILVISWYYIGASCLATFSAFILLAYALSILGKYIANLRTKSVIYTEHRLKILSEVFRYLRAIKIYTLESKFLSKITSSRQTEINHLKLPLVFRSIILSFSMVSSRVIMYFSFLLYLLFLDSNEKFYPETVFVSVALFERLRYSLTWTFPLAISGLHDILSSCERMNEFLVEFNRTELRKSSPIRTSEPHNCTKKGVFISNLTTGYQDISACSGKERSNNFQLKSVNLCVESGQTLSIIGGVGSGKSTLLLTILSEIEAQKADRFEVKGSLAYVSQEVYTLNATIRENILFGSKYEASRYKEVLEICALKQDLEALTLGDQCIVGENGFTLSGGQRARINLARALYSDKDIYLLDDPFSSVDAHLGRHIYQRCIEEFLCHKCVIIATHQLQFIPASTSILLLSGGESIAYGTFDSLMATNESFSEFFNLTKYSNAASSDESSALTLPELMGESMVKPLKKEVNPGKLVLGNLVNRQKGKNSQAENPIKIAQSYDGIISQYWDYLSQGSFGFGSVHLVILSSILTQACLYLCDHWLTLWNESIFDQFSFFLIYTGIVLAIVFFAVLRSYTFYELCLGASERTHNAMADKIIRAPISCFDYIPVGKMMNYFTRDIGILDETLPSALFELNLAFSQVLSIVCVILFLNPYMSAITFLYFYLLFKVRHYYSLPSHVIRQFEVQSRNRIFSHLSSTLNGLTTIRAYSVQGIFRERFYSHLNDHTSTVFLQLATSRFFCTFIDLLAFVYIILILWILFAFSNATNGSLIGHCLGSVFNLIGVAQWALKRSIDSDLWIISFQNLRIFDQLPREEKIGEVAGEKHTWKENSMQVIELDELSVYYRNEHTLYPTEAEDNEQFVLKNINLRINFGEKIGIVGRSGTGKSSLVNALLRFNSHTGQIRFDHNQIESYPLADLRRNISIIPQYPVIFTGNIRENLDLFGRFLDSDLWAVLEKVQLRSMVESFENGLDETINIDSQQMSLGQKQLICLARIMLQNNRLVILDEATAFTDFHTDKLIQQTIRSVFAHCSVIIIAHRLDSIINCDRILVFDNGSLIEDDSPESLLDNEQSHFFQLVRQTGPKMAQRLEASVRQKQKNNNLHLN